MHARMAGSWLAMLTVGNSEHKAEMRNGKRVQHWVREVHIPGAQLLEKGFVSSLNSPIIVVRSIPSNSDRALELLRQYIVGNALAVFIQNDGIPNFFLLPGQSEDSRKRFTPVFVAHRLKICITEFYGDV